MKFLIYFLASFVLLCSNKSYAQDFSIIAVINGEAISNYDLGDRISMIINSSGIEDSIETRKKIAPQALRTIINETLQKQNAHDNNIKVTDDDLSQAIEDIEKNNNLAPGNFDEFVKNQGIRKKSLIDQIKSQILWKKTVAKKIHPRIIVSDYEIDDAIEQLSSQEPGLEIYLSEIVIQIEDEKKEEAFDLSNKLINEINSGASFSSVAKEFSASSTASSGGTIGWISEKHIKDEIRAAIRNTNDHSIVGPVLVGNNYHILKVGNKRSAADSITPERVRELLMIRKMDLESKRYMKKIRKNSFIEVRI